LRVSLPQIYESLEDKLTKFNPKIKKIFEYVSQFLNIWEQQCVHECVHLFLLEPFILIHLLSDDDEKILSQNFKINATQFLSNKTLITFGIDATHVTKSLLLKVINEIERKSDFKLDLLVSDSDEIITKYSNSDIQHLPAHVFLKNSKYENFKIHLVAFHRRDNFFFVGQMPQQYTQGVQFGRRPQIFDQFSLSKTELLGYQKCKPSEILIQTKHSL